jgi:hypothetical protein
VVWSIKKIKIKEREKTSRNMISNEDMVRAGTSHIPEKAIPEKTTVPEKTEEDPPQETTTNGMREMGTKTTKILHLSTRTRIHLFQP